MRTRTKGGLFLTPQELSIPGIVPGPEGEAKVREILAEGGMIAQQFGHLCARASLTVFFRQAFQIIDPGRDLLFSWHLELMCDALEAVALGQTRRLIINVPPRTLKSTLVAKVFPAWWMLHRPQLKVILATYGDELTRPLKEGFDAIVGSPFYQSLQRAPLLHQPKSSEFASPSPAQTTKRLRETKTRGGGRYFATSVGGTLTGQGGDLVILDDPLKAQDAHSEAERTRVNTWTCSTVQSRFDDPANGVFILVMQRLHQEDPSGILLETGDYTHLNLPAEFESKRRFFLQPKFHLPKRSVSVKKGDLLHREQLPRPFLKNMKATMGEGDYRAQYLQDASTAARVSFDTKHLKSYAVPTLDGDCDQLDLVPFAKKPEYMLKSPDLRGAERVVHKAHEVPHAYLQGRAAHVAVSKLHGLEAPEARYLIVQSWDCATSLRSTAH